MAALPKLPTTSARLLAMAIALVGEKAKVQRHLLFPDEHMLEILDGRKEFTWEELDLLTTMLIKEQGALIGANRDLTELLRLRATRRT